MLPPDRTRPWIAEIGWQAAGRNGTLRAVARHPGAQPAAVAESTAIEWPPPDPAAVRAITAAASELEEALLSAGWMAIEPGPAWYAKRFRWPPADSSGGAWSPARAIGSDAAPRAATPEVPAARPALLPATAVFAAIAALAGAEVVLALGHALAAQIADATLAVLLLNARRRSEGPAPLLSLDPSGAAMLALALVALVRVVGIGLPLREFSAIGAQSVVAAAVGFAAVDLARPVGMQLRIVFAMPPPLVGWYTALGGLGLGLVAYLVGAPALWSPRDSTVLVVLAALVAAMTAVVEEIVFRGLVQLTLQRLAGAIGVLAATGLFACTYLGFGSAPLVLVMALAGLSFAWSVARSGVLGAALAGHALLAVGVAVAWPALLGEEPPISLPQPATTIVLSAVVALGALVLLLQGRSSSSKAAPASSPIVAPADDGDATATDAGPASGRRG